MKKYTFLLALSLLYTTEVNATTYLEEVNGLGYISGEGLACQAEGYPSYELIARAYLVTKAKSDKEQAEGMYTYNKSKARAYMRRRGGQYLGCEEIKRKFNQQKIFKSKIYKNGNIKTPEGKILKPRRAYDARYLYNRNENEKEELDNFYEKKIKRNKERAKQEGVYQKILREEKRNRL